MTSSFEKYLVLSIHFLIHNLRLSEINNVVSSSGPTRTQDQDQEEEGGTVAEELVEGELLWAMMVSALNVNCMVTLLEDVQTSVVNGSVKKVLESVQWKAVEKSIADVFSHRCNSSGTLDLF